VNMTRSQAWKYVALAFLKRAAGDPQYTSESAVADFGFCNAIDELETNDKIDTPVADAMREDVDTVKYLNIATDVYVPWPVREGNKHRAFRGMLALLLSYGAAADEQNAPAVLEWQAADTVTL
jgi:hypothetical protein